MCPKPIVTGVLEFTGVLEYWSVGNSFFPLLHHSITPRSDASRTSFLSMFSAYLSNIHHLFWTRVDVFVHLSQVNRLIEEDLFDIAYELELKYHCLIDLIVFDDGALKGRYVKTPIYQKVLAEGAIV